MRFCPKDKKYKDFRKSKNALDNPAALVHNRTIKSKLSGFRTEIPEF
jgi:hypothetical protein